jgi:hypothetical protein
LQGPSSHGEPGHASISRLELFEGTGRKAHVVSQLPSIKLTDLSSIHCSFSV